jgi:signal transduction histidine kinase/DNA-binding response OmpR family regulator
MQVVLLISSDASLGESLRGMLGEAAVVPRQPDVERACERLESLRPDVIAYDAGYTLDTSGLARLRAAAGPAVIGVLTSRDDALADAAFLREGASMVLRKPFGEAEARALLDCAGNRANGGAADGVRDDVSQSDVHARALRWLAGGLMEARDEREFCRELLRATDDLLSPVRCGIVLERSGGGSVELASQRGLRPDAIECWEQQHQRRLLRTLSAHPAAAWRGTERRPDVARVMELLDLEAIVPVLRHGEAGAALLLGGPGAGGGYTGGAKELVTMMARMASRRLEECSAIASGRAEGEMLNDALSGAPVGLVVLDARHRIVAANHAAGDLLGMAPADMTGQSVQRLGSRLADLVLSANGHPGGVVRRMRRPAAAGEIEARLSALPDGGRVISLQAVPEMELPAGEAGKQEFWKHVAERMAQEIKNPMVAVNTFAQLLPRKFDSPDFRDTFSRVVQDEVARINRVVETLFQYAEEPRLSRETQDVNVTVREALAAFLPGLSEAKLELDTSLSAEPLSANIDAEAFKRVMAALMQNAADATPEGGKLRVETVRTPAGVEVRVEDGGAGISPAEAKRVFDPFYSTKEQGMGMGLALAEKLIRAHAGAIEIVRPSGGDRQRFIVRLPAAAGAAAGRGAGEDYADDSGH